MFPMRPCLLLVFWFASVSLAHEYKLCPPDGPCICSGTKDGMAKISHDGSRNGSQFTKLRQIYQNCTKVLGNLELVRLDAKAIEQAGPHPLDFLQDIEEIYGYLVIAHTEFHTISLPRLRIVWGDALYSPNIQENEGDDVDKEFGKSFTILNNPVLEYIDLRSLRAISKGHASVLYNNHYCYLKKIDWSQLLGGDNWKHRYHDQEDSEKKEGQQCNTNHCRCPKDEESYNCSSACKDGHCWGPGPEMCQEIYREACAPQCDQGMCFKRKDMNACCHYSCAAGCHGPYNTDCMACKALNNNGTCVDHCPRPTIYDTTLKKSIKNPNGRFSYGRECVTECPRNMDIHDGACVNGCPTDTFSSPEDRNCKPCLGACPKTCNINTVVSSKNLDDFINCTVVQGRVEIRKDMLVGGYAFNDATSNMDFFDAISEEDLKKLKDVQRITDYLYVQSIDQLSDLGFLSNLEVIEGRNLLHNRYAMDISGNEIMNELGLTSLRRIEEGDLMIKSNHALCYADSLPWDQIVVNGHAAVDDNRRIKTCERERKACDSVCEDGCWGQGNRQCFSCRNFKLQNECVFTCNANDSMYVSGPKECSRCHHSCQECKGPGANNCTKCHHAQLRNECFDECPVPYYNKDDGHCTLCHTNCTDGCSGPSTFQGLGGCNKCSYAIEEEEHGRLRCLAENCPLSNLKDYFPSPPATDFEQVVLRYVCKPCQPTCTQCTFGGIGVYSDGCHCKNLSEFRVTEPGNDQTCVSECSQDRYLDENDTKLAPNGACLACHPECVGCTGPNSTHCLQCKNFKDFPFEDKEKFNCLEVCGPDRPHKNQDGICLDVDVDKQRQEHTRRLLIYIGAGVAALLVLMLVVAVCCFSYRRKWQLQKTLLELPYETKLSYINPKAQPNMAHLRLIKETELKKGGVLGNGAFGVVYKGVWYYEGAKVPVAIKEVLEHKPGAEQEMLEEAGLMACMDNEHLVKLVGICMSKRMMVVTPLMPLGNLLDYTHNNRGRIGSMAILTWCTQIAKGMEHLEQNRLVHRDLAARNVLVQNPHHVRVTDFGLAKMLDYGQEEIYVEGRVPVKWLALECIHQRRFTHKSDVWAFGVTVWELTTFGEKPYPNVPIEQIPRMLDRGERLPQPTMCTHEVYMSLIKCWMLECDCRPSFTELRKTFEDFCQDPPRYLVIQDDQLLRLPSYTPAETNLLLRDLLPDDVGLDDPMEYLDNSHYNISTPSTPASPSKMPLMAQDRHQSVLSSVSSRYQKDPVPWHPRVHDSPEASTSGYVVKTDSDNYVVPDSKNNNSINLPDAPVAYTPVVTGRPSMDNLYYNDPKSVVAVSNLEYLQPEKSREVPESETTV